MKPLSPLRNSSTSPCQIIWIVYTYLIFACLVTYGSCAEAATTNTTSAAPTTDSTKLQTVTTISPQPVNSDNEQSADDMNDTKGKDPETDTTTSATEVATDVAENSEENDQAERDQPNKTPKKSTDPIESESNSTKTDQTDLEAAAKENTTTATSTQAPDLEIAPNSTTATKANFTTPGPIVNSTSATVPTAATQNGSSAIITTTDTTIGTPKENLTDTATADTHDESGTASPNPDTATSAKKDEEEKEPKENSTPTPHDTKTSSSPASTTTSQIKGTEDSTPAGSQSSNRGSQKSLAVGLCITAIVLVLITGGVGYFYCKTKGSKPYKTLEAEFENPLYNATFQDAASSEPVDGNNSVVPDGHVTINFS